MEVYLVRHGQTGGNTAHRHQIETTRLTFKGEAQAKEAAKRIAKLQPTHLLTSPMMRALETARIIGKECDLIPETSVVFAELERPSNLDGNYHVSFNSLIYYFLWYFGLFKPVDGTGEPYKSFRARIAAARDYLETLPTDARVVVVSHSVFINLYIAHVCRNKPLGLLAAMKVFRKVLTTRNTEINQLTYNPEAQPGTCAWQLQKSLES